jgi:N-methylhydantoinase B
VSAAAARLLYGVLVGAGGRVDLASTQEARARLRALRFRLTAVLDGDVFEAGPVSRRRVCRLNPSDARAAGIGEDWVVELDAGRAAPLRAWTRLDASVAQGTLPIDDRGLSILKAAAGELLHLRAIAPARPLR